MKQKMDSVVTELNKILLGKDTQVRLALCGLLARGHLLIEDIPGMGKTTLSHALAKIMGLSYQRIQFTNDLLPADVLGYSMYDKQAGSLVFIRARSSPRLFWRTKSIGPRPEPKAPCWRPWKNDRCPLKAKPGHCPRRFS